MKNFTKGKSVSRMGKIFVALALTIALLLGSVTSLMAEEIVVDAGGYDTHYTHVYSPMDLIEGNTASKSTAKMKNEAYDSSIWKFAAKADGETFFKDSNDIDAPTVEPVYGGVKVSWNAFDEGSYTVLVYGEDGAYAKKFTAEDKSVVLKDLKLNSTYAVQIAGATKASKIASFKNDRVAADVFAKLKTNDDLSFVLDAPREDAVIEKGKSGTEFFVELDKNAKEAFNANGAIILEVDTELLSEFNDVISEDSETMLNDCWIGMDTLFYPTDNDWKVVSKEMTDFYKNVYLNGFVFVVGGENIRSSNMVANGIKSASFKNATNFTDGYIVFPLDDFANFEGQTVDLIETTKTTGKLRFDIDVLHYYAADGTSKSQKSLLDRSITFTNAYIVSDYSDYVANYIDNDANTTSAYTENVIMAAGKYSGSGNKKYFPFTAEGLSSTYNFYCSTYQLDKISNYKQRTIEYTAADGEGMSFGFTAPVAGTYEIAAPIGVTPAEGETVASANVKYSVIKEDVYGNKTALQAEQIYENQDRFCEVIANLSQGETVWLEATATAGTVIEIGIPQAILLSDSAVVANDDGTTTYTFRALDYLENTKTNGVAYTKRSILANTKSVWEVGYFSDTAVVEYNSKNKRNEYVYQNITVPTAKGAVDTELLNRLKPYEMIISGLQYSPLDFRTKEDGSINYEGESNTNYTTIGELSPASDKSTLGGISKVTTNCYGVESGLNEDEVQLYTVVGQYYRFTAPVSGTATVYLNTNDATFEILGQRIATVHNGNAVNVAALKNQTNTPVEIKDVKAGDEITIITYTYNKDKDDAGDFTEREVGAPMVEMTGKYASVSYNAAGGEYFANYGQLLNAGTEIVLPSATKPNALFKGWSIGDSVYQANDKVTVEADMEFTALYDYYGDLDKDSMVTDADYVEFRKVLLGLETLTVDSELADLNANGDLDIRDFVRMAKWRSGEAVTFGK